MIMRVNPSSSFACVLLLSTNTINIIVKSGKHAVIVIAYITKCIIIIILAMINDM